MRAHELKPAEGATAAGAAEPVSEAGSVVNESGIEIKPLYTAEDVDVIGLSILSGAHLPLCRKLKALLDDQGLGDKLLIVGGNIPRGDHEELKALGVDAVFPTGSKLDEMTDFIRENLP